MSLRPKDFESAKASFKGLKRGQIARSANQGNKTGNAAGMDGKAAQGLKARKGLIRKPTDWDRERAKLKPLYEEAGITSCEFDFLPHECWGDWGISFAHSRKRRDPLFEMYETAIACPIAHQLLDEGMSHDQMYDAVMQAINIRGGVIQP